MKKRVIIIFLILLAIAAAAVVAWMFVGGKPLPKTVSLDGYEISVPKDWVAAADGTLTDGNGRVVGKYTLINEKPVLSDITVYADVAATGEKEQTDFSENTKKCIFGTEQGKAVEYLMYDIPNPEPYAVSILLYMNGVNQKTADRIAESFRIPAIGKKPPLKNIPAPLYEEIKADKTGKLTLSDGSVLVKNVSLLDAFIQLQNEGNDTGLDIISYRREEDGTEIPESWVHIENADRQGYMYIYSDRGDGLYTYENNPVIFQSITKEVLEEKGITAYRLKIGEAETTSLLEIPMDVYRDNAEDLLALRTETATEESVAKILDEIVPKESREGVTIQKTDAGVTLKFAEGTETDAKKISKDAAVIFALSPDVEHITAESADGKTYVLNRDTILSQVETTPEKTVGSVQDFTEFAEKLENIEAAKPKGEENAGNNGTVAGGVLYSGTVVVSANTMVTHPRTGERVAIGPYAEARGYGAYLGKPITVTVSKKGNGYVATASCGGAVIASQAYESEAAARSAIAMIKAYS